MGGLSVNTNPNRLMRHLREFVSRMHCIYMDLLGTSITSCCLARVAIYDSWVTKVFPIYGVRQLLVVVIQGERLLDFRRVPTR